MLDPVGATIEKWSIDVKQVIEINFGKCDYSSYQMIKPYIIIKPETCVLFY